MRWIFDLAAAHGWDATLTQAGWLLGEGNYSAEPVDELKAAIAFWQDDLSGFWLVQSRAEAIDLLARLTGPQAPRVGKCGPEAAADVLARAMRDEWGK